MQAEKISKCLKGTECLPTNILQSHCRFPGELFVKASLRREKRMTIKPFPSRGYLSIVSGLLHVEKDIL